MFFSLSCIVKLCVDGIIRRLRRLFVYSLLFFVFYLLKDIILDRLIIGLRIIGNYLINLSIFLIRSLLGILIRLFISLLCCLFCLDPLIFSLSDSEKLCSCSLLLSLLGFLFCLGKREKLFLLLLLSCLGVLFVKLLLIARCVKDSDILIGVIFFFVS